MKNHGLLSLTIYSAGMQDCIILSLPQVKAKVWEPPFSFAGNINSAAWGGRLWEEFISHLHHQ